MAADVETAELPLESAGQQLKRAREASGKTLAEVSAATKIPERLLLAIEQSQFSQLPSRIYTIGFARSYARLVGLDEAAIVTEVRAELDGAAGTIDPVTAQAFVPGDPARVPGLRLALTAGIGALVVFVGALVFWHNAGNPAGTLPSILPADPPPTANSSANAAGMVTKSAAPPAAASPVPTPGGTVALSALSPGIWVKLYDTSGKTFFQGQLAQGQSLTVPADAQGPLIWTGRPDALAITVAGKPVAKLSEKQKIMKGVPISAAAILARNTPPGAAVAPGGAMPMGYAASTVAQ